jgi:hypothetical protein
MRPTERHRWNSELFNLKWSGANTRPYNGVKFPSLPPTKGGHNFETLPCFLCAWQWRTHPTVLWPCYDACAISRSTKCREHFVCLIHSDATYSSTSTILIPPTVTLPAQTRYYVFVRTESPLTMSLRKESTHFKIQTTLSLFHLTISTVTYSRTRS